MKTITLLQCLINRYQEITDIAGEIEETSAAFTNCTEELTEDGKYTTNDLLTDVQQGKETTEGSLQILDSIRTGLESIRKVFEPDSKIKEISTSCCRENISECFFNRCENQA